MNANARNKAVAKAATTSRKASARTEKPSTNPIPDTTVKRVIRLRKSGTPWPKILEELNETKRFIHRVRPLMKKVDPKSVLALGPGSTNYGKKAKSPTKKGAPEGPR